MPSTAKIIDDCLEDCFESINGLDMSEAWCAAVVALEKKGTLTQEVKEQLLHEVSKRIAAIAVLAAMDGTNETKM